MPIKRCWDEANPASDESGRPASASGQSVRRNSRGNSQEPQTKSPSRSGQSQHVPMISRKVKACSACRKHKIKCIMDDGNPPCRRCLEKGLGCVLNKSLQTLISERTESTESMSKDLEMIHSSLQTVLKALDLPALNTLNSSKQLLQTPVSDEPSSHFDDAGPSCDNSPKVSPADDNELPNVPIQSVYHLTKLSALRSPDVNGNSTSPKTETIDDFISRGVISLSDAERLFRLYMDHLDPFFYCIGGRYDTLHELRSKSSFLAVSLLTVAALHDPQSNAIYGVCRKEFKRIMASSIFNRNIDRDYLRAVCVASYWLSDISWMLSGYGSRRAAEFNILGQYRRAVAQNDEEAADFVRLWYSIFICDQHLSTLWARPSVIREDITIQGHEAFCKGPSARDEDPRLVSQVALLSIIHNIRDLFGPDTGEQLPQVYLMQISTFSRRLDQWIGYWSPLISECHSHIGTFPRKGALLHFYFSKLWLYSHVFRGLHDCAVPEHFLECARQAINSGTAIVNMLITDPVFQTALVGMPSYMISMAAYACIILAKSAMMIRPELIERNVVMDMMSRLIGLFRSVPVGKWHLVHLMAEGLEKIVKTLSSSRGSDLSDAAGLVKGQASQNDPSGQFDAGVANPADLTTNNLGLGAESPFNFDSNFLMDYNMDVGASQLMYLSSGPAVFDNSDLSPTFPG